VYAFYGGTAATFWVATPLITFMTSDAVQLDVIGTYTARTVLSPALSLGLLGSVSGTVAHSATDGEGGFEWSYALATDLRIELGPVVITASRAEAYSTLECRAGEGMFFGGGSNVIDLQVNGVPVEVSGEANQRVPLLVGELVVNEQLSGFVSPTEAGVIVTALRVSVPGVVDIWAVHAYNGMVCFY
jgi:hypothetical protein